MGSRNPARGTPLCPPNATTSSSPQGVICFSRWRQPAVSMNKKNPESLQGRHLGIQVSIVFVRTTHIIPGLYLRATMNP